MRVAVFAENFLPKLDGVTRTLAMLLEHLERRGHQTLLFAPVGAPARYAGAEVIPVQGVPLPFYPELRALLPSPLLETRLARFRPDVVHVAEPILLGAAGIKWAQRRGAAVVASYHTNLADYCKHFHLTALGPAVWHYRKLLHDQCATTLCPSSSTLRDLSSRGFLRLGLWPRGVDSQLFHPGRRSDAWRGQVGAGKDDVILLYVGRLSFEKNLAHLIAAYRSVANERVRLVLVGDGPARGDLERALRCLPATFTGYLQGEALATAYASADVFAFPSETETFGQVVNEAMASGLAVAALDADGVRDQVVHGETALLSPRGDVAAFAQALQQLAGDAELRRSLAGRARLVAEERTWEGVMDRLIDVYAQHAGIQGQVAA